MRNKLTLIPAALVLIFSQNTMASTENLKNCELSITTITATSRPTSPGSDNQNQKVTRASSQVYQIKLDEKQGLIFSHSQRFASTDGASLTDENLLKSLNGAPESISIELKKQQEQFIFSLKSGASVQQSDGRRTFDPEAFNIEIKSKTPSFNFDSSENKTPKISKIPEDSRVKITLNCAPSQKTITK